MTTKKATIITLLPSIDSDLSRWLTQHWKVDHIEKPHAPIFHVIAVKMKGGKEAVPYLILPDGQFAGKYEGMKNWIPKLDKLASPEDRLIPDETAEKDLYDEVLKLHKEFRWETGGGSANWSYYHLFKHRKIVWQSLVTGVPWYEKILTRLFYRKIVKLMSKGLGLSEENSKSSLIKVKKGFDDCDALLADGRQYLLGNRLTLADLAWSVSVAPVILARGYGGHLPTLDNMPPEMKDEIIAFQKRPSGRFAQRIYDEHRNQVFYSD